MLKTIGNPEERKRHVQLRFESDRAASFSGIRPRSANTDVPGVLEPIGNLTCLCSLARESANDLGHACLLCPWPAVIYSFDS
jgi:hypothetical protein